jgi:hypothetical protein
VQKSYYGVQRNMECQLYAALRLDAIGHGTLGRKGIMALQKHTSCVSCRLEFMDVTRDWLYTEEMIEQCFCPIVQHG